MTTFDRRSFMTATAAVVAGSAVAEARECTRTYDWETMSLDERNLAFNNVVQVTPAFAAKKTEEWTVATAKLREQHPQHLNLAYGPKERNKWDIYPASNPKAPCLVHIHGGYWQRGSKETFGCLIEGAAASRPRPRRPADVRSRSSGSCLAFSSPLFVKHRCYNAGCEIDQIGACRCVHWHGAAFL